MTEKEMTDRLDAAERDVQLVMRKVSWLQRRCLEQMDVIELILTHLNLPDALIGD